MDQSLLSDAMPSKTETRGDQTPTAATAAATVLRGRLPANRVPASSRASLTGTPTLLLSCP